MGFSLPLVLFKNEFNLILMRDCHITHQLNKMWKLKRTTIYHCIFKTKGHVKLKKYWR